MNTMAWRAAALTILIGAAGVTRAETKWVFTTPLKGVVAHGRAFAYLDELPGGLYLSYAPLAGGPSRHTPTCGLVSRPPSVWQLAHGYFWVSSDFPPDVNFGGPDALQRYRWDDLLDGKLIPGPGAKDGDPANFIMSDSLLSPLGQARQHIVWLNGKFPVRLFYDYWPVSEDKVLLFQLCNVAGADRRKAKADKETGGLAVVQLPDRNDPKFNEPHWSLAVIAFTNEWDAKDKTFQGETWERQGTIEIGFRERFRVLGKGDDYYFVTASGKLYRAPKPDKGADRKMEAVWDDEKRPVVAFITDADADRTFLFCKPDGDGKGVYFEMGEKPDPQPYDASKVPEAKPDDPLPAVLAYSKILLADKKIKDKE